MTEIICDIGINHRGSTRLAIDLIDIAKKYGATAAKFQLYDVDKLFTPSWEWYEHVKGTQLTFNQAKLLSDHCKDVGIEFLCSVFDSERFQWCEDLGMKRYKIASRSLSDEALVNLVASTGKDMIVSLGLWTHEYRPVIPTTGKVSFLYCISKYPTLLADLDFSKIDFMHYDGFSDHTSGLDATLMAIARGAKIIEKHLTFNKKAYGPDHICSMDPGDLKHLMTHVKNFELIKK